MQPTNLHLKSITSAEHILPTLPTTMPTYITMPTLQCHNALHDCCRRIILTTETNVAYVREKNVLDTPQKSVQFLVIAAVVMRKKNRKPDRDGKYKPKLCCPQKGANFTFSSERRSIYPLQGYQHNLHCTLSFVLDIFLNTALTNITVFQHDN